MAVVRIITRSSVADCHVYVGICGTGGDPMSWWSVFHDPDWHPHKNNAEAFKRHLRDGLVLDRGFH